MRQARALPLPNEALHIEEIKFWLKIMQEHTHFIGGGLPAKAADFCEAAQEFHRAFTSLMQQSENLKSVKQSGAFVREVSNVMGEFCRYQREILAARLSGKMGGTNFPFFLDHMLREAKCFSDFLERMQDGAKPEYMVSHTRQIVIWLRFMADHACLTAHLIDPAERRIGKMAMDFTRLFDDLVAEARDLSSMLYRYKGEVRVFRRFLLDIRVDVQRLRDFNKMAEELLADCRLIGVLSAELAAHMKREAEHALLMIALLEKELIKHCPDDFQDDADDDLWLDSERIEPEPEAGETEAATEIEEAAPMVDAEQVRQEEPVIAILAAEELRSEAIAANPPVICDAVECGAEKPAAVVPEPEAPVLIAPMQEKAYVKASTAKAMPGKFAGKTPGERYERPKKQQQRLPRALGKIDAKH